MSRFSLCSIYYITLYYGQLFTLDAFLLCTYAADRSNSRVLFFNIVYTNEKTTNQLDSTAAVCRESNYSRRLQHRVTRRRVETTPCITTTCTTNGSAAVNSEIFMFYSSYTKTMTTHMSYVEFYDWWLNRFILLLLLHIVSSPLNTRMERVVRFTIQKRLSLINIIYIINIRHRMKYDPNPYYLYNTIVLNTNTFL